MTKTLLNFNLSNQVKSDFNTICKLNCTTMTSELVRFINNYISQENVRFKSYQVDSKEINELKQRKLTPTHIPQRTSSQKTWETSY